MDFLRNDLRLALRAWRRSPWFFLAAAATLALGIGAATALFSVVDSVLLRPLPLPESERLVKLMMVTEDTGERYGVNFHSFHHWRQESESFEVLAAYRRSPRQLLGADRPERLQAVEVSAGYFSVIGLEPALGRVFGQARASGEGRRQAVLSSELWQRRFAADPRILGRELNLDGDAFRVVGVLPATTAFPALGWGDLWIPLDLDEAAALQEPVHGFSVLGRIARTASLESVRSEMGAISRGLAAARPETNEGWGVEVQPLHWWIVGSVGPGLTAGFLAALGILLMACANVANLFLVRFWARGDEMRTRAALGAGRRHILAPLLGEGVSLAFAGCAGGVALAVAGVEVLQRVGASRIPRLDEVSVDGRVLAVTVVLSLLAALTSLIPALKALGRWGVSPAAGPARGRPGSERPQALLVSFQVALALVLVVGAGLVLHSQKRLQRVSPGFDARGLSTASLLLAHQGALTQGETGARLQQLEERVRALPGVEDLAFGRQPLPLAGDQGIFAVYPPDRPRQRGNEIHVLAGHVSPDYFRTLRIPLLQGRPFAAGESWESSRGVIVNETLARRFWPGRDPIGREIAFAGGGDKGRVVGVVGDTRQLALHVAPKDQIFVPMGAAPALQRLVLRCPPALRDELWSRIEEEAWTVAGATVSARMNGEEILERGLARHRFFTLLLQVASLVAALLGGIGIYGVVAVGVSRRRHEIGVRMALGATPARVLRGSLALGLRPVLLGLALGFPGVLLASRGLRELLFETAALEPGVLLAATAMLCGAALLACWLPARRAAATDPVETLRRAIR